MNNGRVISTAKIQPDRSEGLFCPFLTEVHCDVSGDCDISFPGMCPQLVYTDTEVFRHFCLDYLDGQALFLPGDHIAEYLVCRFQGNLISCKGRRCYQFYKSTFKFPDIGGNMAGYKLQYFFRQGDSVDLGLFLKNRNPGLKIRWLNVSDKAAHEAVDYMFHHIGDFFGRAVGREYYLLVLKQKAVEYSVEFFLCAGLATQKMDIINKKKFDTGEFFVKRGRVFFISDVVHVLINEFLAGYVDNFFNRIFMLSEMPDSLQKVCLAKAGTAVDGKRVEGGLSRGLCNSQTGCMGKAVAVTDHK